MDEPIANPKAMKASKVLGRFANCQRLLEEAGLTFEAFQWPIDDADFRARLVEFWMSNGSQKAIAPAVSIFPVTVDHTLSRKEMISAGSYDSVNSDITEKHFARDKKEGKEKVDPELIHLDKQMSSEAVLAELKHRGYRPATLSELLAFGSTYKNEQRKYPIVALGSVWRYWSGDRRVPCLWGDAGRRGLGLDWFGLDWSGHCRCLAVRES